MRTTPTALALGAPPNAAPFVGFGSFRLDRRGGILLRDSKAVPLRPKTWAMLLYLLERRGALVTKDELLDALWPDVVVTPDTLNKSIGELRRALSDDSHAPRFIETVHRRGFRFIAATHQISDDDPLVRDAPPAAARPDLALAEQSTRPFVGRAAELRMLSAAFARAQAGERQTVFVTGPGGIGKSALVDSFVGSLHAGRTAAPVWIGRAACFEHYGSGEAYLPVLEAVERLARRSDAAPLLDLMRRTAPMWLTQMPWLIGEADAYTLRQSVLGLSAERMPRELATLIETLTADLTLVLVFEDLHWCDPSTVDLLSLLAQRREPARLLLIGTYRPAELVVREHVLASAARSLRAQQRTTEIQLGGLDAEAVRSYLAARFPDNDFPPELVSRIHSHTDGDPLFMVGIVNDMRSRGWILDTAPGWQLSTPIELVDLGVPDDVRCMIETQFHRLSPGDCSLLEAASVAGNQITARVLAAALGCEPDIIERHCESLSRTQQFLCVAGTIEWPDGSVDRRHRFTHELYRRVVYEEIPEERRARMQQRVGEILEALHGARARTRSRRSSPVSVSTPATRRARRI